MIYMINNLWIKKISSSTLTTVALIMIIGVLSINRGTIMVNDVPEDVTINIMHPLYSGRYYRKLTYENLMKERELVVVVEITNQAKTLKEKYPFECTIYEATVINTLKGPENLGTIQIYQIGAYDETEKSYTHLEGLPLFLPNSRWLLFMNPVGFERNLERELPGVYHAGGLEALAVINGKLYPTENAEKIFLPSTEIKGLSLSAFSKAFAP